MNYLIVIFITALLIGCGQKCEVETDKDYFDGEYHRIPVCEEEKYFIDG